MPAQHHATLHALYRDHHGWLSHWLRTKLGCTQQAADLAQNTFIRVLQSRQLMQLQEPRAFLTVLAKRELYTFWRRRDLEQAYLQALAQQPQANQPSPEDMLLIREAIAALDQLLNGLPPKIRQAFLLSRLDGLTHVQIAESMGKSVATIERYMKQALLHCYLSSQ